MAAFKYKKEVKKSMFKCNSIATCSYAWKCAHAVPHSKTYCPHGRGGIPSDCPRVNHFIENGLDQTICCEKIIDESPSKSNSES